MKQDHLSTLREKPLPRVEAYVGLPLINATSFDTFLIS